MTAVPTTTSEQLRARGRLADRIGDVSLRGISSAAALAAIAALLAIVYKVFHLAHPAMSHFGLHFLSGTTWDPVHKTFGALPFVYGTAVSALIALVIATP